MEYYLVHLGYHSNGDEIVGISFMDDATDKTIVVSLDRVFVHFKDYNNSVIMFEEIQEYLNECFIEKFENYIKNNIYIRSKMFPSLEGFSYDNLQPMLQRREDVLFPLDESTLRRSSEIYNVLNHVFDLTRCVVLPDIKFDFDETIPFFYRSEEKCILSDFPFSGLQLINNFFVLPTFFTDCDVIKRYII